MKILLTTDWFEPVVNGVVASTATLRRELELRGHEVRILTLSDDRTTSWDDRICRLGSVGAGLLYPDARIGLPASRRVLAELIDWVPDVVHSQCEFTTFVWARRVAAELDVPLVHTYHTNYEDYTHYFSPSRPLGHAMVSTLSRALINKVDAVVAPTLKVRRLLRGYGIDRPVHVIPSGIDVARYAADPPAGELDALRGSLGISRDRPLLVSVGRLAKEKNLDEVLHYLARISEARPDSPVARAGLLVVGDGPHRRHLTELAHALGLDDRVTFTGAVPPHHTPWYYRLGDAFVSGSTSETQGLTYCEALAGGVPLLCRADPCLDGLVRQGVNGWQYRGIDDFAGHLTALLTDPRLRRDASIQARETAWSRCSAHAFASAVEALYLQRIATRRRDRVVGHAPTTGLTDVA